MKKSCLLFTHGSDIDGMGSIIISKLLFERLDYNFCETSDLDEKIISTIKSKEIYNYDYIFITDLCPSNETIEIINNDEILKKKLVIIDHHKSNLDRVPDYNFIKITISNKKGMCSATSLFYEYLLSNKLITPQSNNSKYVELTRLEDTWEWVNNNVYDAHNLTHLFNHYGRDDYLEHIISKLINNKRFYLDKKDKVLIEFIEKQISIHMKRYINNMKEIMMDDLKGVIVIIDYQYRNEFPEYLRKNNYPYDFAMMICFDHSSVSIRTVYGKKIRFIAEKFGGGGHDKASTFRIDNKIDMIYDLILNKT